MTMYTLRIATAMDRARVIQQLVAGATVGRIDAIHESAAHLIIALHLLHAAGYNAEQLIEVALLPACAEIIVPIPKDENDLH